MEADYPLIIIRINKPSNVMNSINIEKLVRELCKNPSESEWLEFKSNFDDFETIGELVSGLSNSALLADRTYGYVVWGVEDGTHNLVGTKFKPKKLKKGNEDFEAWLIQQITPSLDIKFYEETIDGKDIVVLRIPAAKNSPTQFKNKRKVRIGSYQKDLSKHTELERKLWQLFEKTSFEERIAATGLNESEVENLLDFDAYYDALGIPKPRKKNSILSQLAKEGFIKKDDSSQWLITNLGAIIIARDLDDFDGLGEKKYEEKKGYVVGTKELIKFINIFIPDSETLNGGKLSLLPRYPDFSIRELIVNALIHQDFLVNSSGPLIEIFEDRIEITNPGIPLGNIDRLLDEPPKTRNIKTVKFMRRAGLCEDAGSGVDRVVEITEQNLLPPPLWEVFGNTSLRVSLFSYRNFRFINRKDRLRACYLHSCLKYIERGAMTNASLRARFGLENRHSSKVSRLISDAIEEELIKPFEVTQSRRSTKYLPIWA